MSEHGRKKYEVLENLLIKIHQSYIVLPKIEKDRNKVILMKVVSGILGRLKKNPLFASLYQSKFYGGSYYDGLKIRSPDEYDLDLVLQIPKCAHAKIETGHRPGYVRVSIDMETLKKKVDEHEKFKSLDKLIVDDKYLSTVKVKSWIEGLVFKICKKECKKKIKINGISHLVKYCVVKSGPAFTLKVEGSYDGQLIKIDIDLVSCFIFSENQWPMGYRSNPCPEKKHFFAVPKSPTNHEDSYWRLSFQDQERQLLTQYSRTFTKPSMRLLKQIRDRNNHNISSYLIKTIYLWELQNFEEKVWKKSLSFVFVLMLKRYCKYVERKSIPYYWNEEFNLLEDLSAASASNIVNNLRKIISTIEKIHESPTNVYGVLPSFIRKNDMDLENFKKEVPIPKKFFIGEKESCTDKNLQKMFADI